MDDLLSIENYNVSNAWNVLNQSIFMMSIIICFPPTYTWYNFALVLFLKGSAIFKLDVLYFLDCGLPLQWTGKVLIIAMFRTLSIKNLHVYSVLYFFKAHSYTLTLFFKS